MGEHIKRQPKELVRGIQTSMREAMDCTIALREQEHYSAEDYESMMHLFKKIYKIAGPVPEFLKYTVDA